MSSYPCCTAREGRDAESESCLKGREGGREEGGWKEERSMERMKRRKLSTSDSSGEQERSTSRQTSEGGTSTSKRERFWENQRTNNRSFFTQGVERGILEKLRKRECISAPPSSSIGAIRRMCIDVYPSRAAVAKKIPEFHIRSFTPDGRFLVCFSLDLRSVVLYRYCMPDHAIPKTGSVTFETFFKKMFELQVAPEGGDALQDLFSRHAPGRVHDLGHFDEDHGAE